MNITEFKEKLTYIKADSIPYEITLVEHSGSPDFSLPGEMTGNPKYAVTDWTSALALVHPFYRICMTVHTSPNSDFQMEAWLPEASAWNHRTITVGNSGSAMTVNHLALLGGIMDGFATFHCNLSTRDDLDRGIENPEIWKDFGWRATHLTTEIGKQIVQLLYDKSADYDYFYGCSTGGQQAIAAAERFPEDYDGIVAVAPAISRTYLHIYFVWNLQNLMYPDGSFVFSGDEVRKLSDLTIGFFQSLGDGMPGDGFVTNPRLNQCQMNHLFDTIKDADFLNEEQLQRLWKIYQGPINPRTGERIYCGFAPGAELGFFGLNAVKIPGYTYEYLYPVRWGMDQKFENFDIWGFDFDADVDKTMKLATDLNGDFGDLDAFKAAGRKLLMTSGAMDTVVPEPNITRYYERVTERQGGIEATHEFFRYFLVPGFSHSIRGGLNGVDYIGHSNEEIPVSAGYIPVAYFDSGLVRAMIDWVEKDIAPEQITATGFNEMIKPAALVPDISQGIRFQRSVGLYSKESYL